VPSRCRLPQGEAVHGPLRPKPPRAHRGGLLGGSGAVSSRVPCTRARRGVRPSAAPGRSSWGAGRGEREGRVSLFEGASRHPVESVLQGMSSSARSRARFWGHRCQHGGVPPVVGRRGRTPATGKGGRGGDHSASEVRVERPLYFRRKGFRGYCVLKFRVERPLYVKSEGDRCTSACSLELLPGAAVESIGHAGEGLHQKVRRGGPLSGRRAPKLRSETRGALRRPVPLSGPGSGRYRGCSRVSLVQEEDGARVAPGFPSARPTRCSWSTTSGAAHTVTGGRRIGFRVYGLKVGSCDSAQCNTKYRSPCISTTVLHKVRNMDKHTPSEARQMC